MQTKEQLELRKLELENKKLELECENLEHSISLLRETIPSTLKRMHQALTELENS